MEWTPKRRVLSAIHGSKADKTPVTSVSGCGGTVCVDMQKAMGIYWPEGHKDAGKMVNLALGSCKLSGFDSIRVPFDFVVEPEALGCEIKWYDGLECVPAVCGHLYEQPDNLRIPDDFVELGRIPVVLEAIRRLRKEVGDYYPISSLALGPFSIAAALVGLGKLLKWTIKRPDHVKEFVNFGKDITIEYARAQYKAGSDIVEVADPTSSGDLISPAMFREFVKPALTEIAQALSGIRVLHICGSTDSILRDMVETGFDGVNVEEHENVANIKPQFGEVKILGNVSSTGTLVLGSSSDVEKAARRALEGGVDLLEPSCGISPITPLDNLKALVKARDEFYAETCS